MELFLFQCLQIRHFSRYDNSHANILDSRKKINELNGCPPHPQTQEMREICEVRWHLDRACLGAVTWARDRGTGG